MRFKFTIELKLIQKSNFYYLGKVNRFKDKYQS